jgi:hypothetical protein
VDLPDFDREPNVAWLKGGLAKRVAWMDREDGGSPTIMKCQYKRCQRCSKLHIQIGAEVQRRTIAFSKDKGIEPCGPDCDIDRNALREARRRDRG